MVMFVKFCWRTKMFLHIFLMPDSLMRLKYWAPLIRMQEIRCPRPEGSAQGSGEEREDRLVPSCINRHRISLFYCSENLNDQGKLISDGWTSWSYNDFRVFRQCPSSYKWGDFLLAKKLVYLQLQHCHIQLKPPFQGLEYMPGCFKLLKCKELLFFCTVILKQRRTHVNMMICLVSFSSYKTGRGVLLAQKLIGNLHK